MLGRTHHGRTAEHIHPTLPRWDDVASFEDEPVVLQSAVTAAVTTMLMFNVQAPTTAEYERLNSNSCAHVSNTNLKCVVSSPRPLASRSRSKSTLK
jgi:hypothetical protein